ncbi:MAG: hypothetical protein IKM70_03965 [Firmicutes bacterium]|nr:hypothetical protein [Bacillota bacterium]
MGRILLKNGLVVSRLKSFTGDLLMEDDIILAIGKFLHNDRDPAIYDVSGCFILPGFIDIGDAPDYAHGVTARIPAPAEYLNPAELPDTDAAWEALPDEGEMPALLCGCPERALRVYNKGVLECRISIEQLAEALSTMPARLGGREFRRRGRLSENMFADVVVWDPSVTTDGENFGAVRYCFKDGALVYSAEAAE